MERSAAPRSAASDANRRRLLSERDVAGCAVKRSRLLVASNPTQTALASLGEWDDAPLSPAQARADWNSELATIRGGGAAENGVNLFECAKCRARFGVYSHT